jgi:D-alanyl-D-alanine carboxypeptidase/D-alanyl-D-alanine-endopeptidase (penicillin-binding protein 4)
MRRPAHGGGAGERLKRWIAAALGLVVVVVAITLALFGSLSHTSTKDEQLAAGTPVPGSPAAKVPSRHGAGSSVPGSANSSDGVAGNGLEPSASQSASVLALQHALDKQLRLGGPEAGALVEDLTTGRRLYAVRADVGRPPASVEKVYTTVAVMRVLGPGTRLHTDILGTGHLRHGVWHGNLYLRGGGDPTFGDPSFNQSYLHGYGPTAIQLVSQLRRHGIRRVTGWVFADESMFDKKRGGLMTNYAPDTPDYGGQMSALTYDHGSATNKLSPALFTVKQVVATMTGNGIQARWSKHTATTPGRARMVAGVNSPPMSVMTRLMDVPSDDLFADEFTKQLGVLFGGGGTLSQGARVISHTIASSYGLHPTIHDGSGLSRNDRSSPLEVVDLLRDVWRTAVGGELAASLPTVGMQGTVQTIGVKTAAQGRCIAKTGTLDGVSNLAGYCRARGDHELAFALEIDGPPNWVALALESKMVGAIARY